MWSSIVALASNVAGYFFKREENYVARTKNKEKDSIRKERDENDEKIDNWTGDIKP